MEESSQGEEDGGDDDNSSTPKLMWQKSLERLWPFRSSSPNDEVKVFLTLSVSPRHSLTSFLKLLPEDL